MAKLQEIKMIIIYNILKAIRTEGFSLVIKSNDSSTKKFVYNRVYDNFKIIGDGFKIKYEEMKNFLTYLDIISIKFDISKERVVIKCESDIIRNCFKFD